MNRLVVSGVVAAMAVAGCDRGAAAISHAEDGPPAAREAEAADEPGAQAPAAAHPQNAARVGKNGETEETMGEDGAQVALHADLRAYVERVVAGFDTIPEDRRRELRKLALFIKTKRSAGEPANLTFICTHNSRRSHMGQLWASAASAWYGVEGVGTFSGGTEASAFNPRAVAALERAGFQIQKPDGAGENPRYEVTYDPGVPAMTAFSKVYDDDANPSDGFAAVMTCSEADKNCPVVQGAALRVAIPYVDPKEADDTPEESQRYDERAQQIATEVFFLFSQV